VAPPRNGRNVVSRKMSIWVGHYDPLERFCLWTKVHQFFSSNVEGIVVISDVRYVDPFRRYSRSNSKVVKNRVEIWTLFGPRKFLGAGLPKVVRVIMHPCLAARRLEKLVS